MDQTEDEIARLARTGKTGKAAKAHGMKWAAVPVLCLLLDGGCVMHRDQSHVLLGGPNFTTESAQSLDPDIIITATASGEYHGKVVNGLDVVNGTIIELNISVANNSAFPIFTGSAAYFDTVEFEIFDPHGGHPPLTEFGENELFPFAVSIRDAHTIESGGQLVQNIDLSSVFDLRAVGRYTFRLRKEFLRIHNRSDGPQDWVWAESQRITFDVIDHR